MPTFKGFWDFSENTLKGCEVAQRQSACLSTLEALGSIPTATETRISQELNVG